MLVSLKSILENANKEGYAVIAANVFNLETIEAAIGAAWEERSPIILNFGENLKDTTGIYDFASVAKIITSKYNVPVCINPDHSLKYEGSIKAIRTGFISIMVDRSLQSYNINVKR